MLNEKKLKRKIQRECRDQITEQLHNTDAMTVLREGQSLESHKRMRMSQSFGTPEQKINRALQSSATTSRKHSPNFDNVQWDKDSLLAELKDWPSDVIVNWSEIARKYNIPGSNRGQVAKEFATESGLDVCHLDGRQQSSRLQARKLRMPGGEVSVPSRRTVESIKQDWAKMIESGELTLGEPCYPHTITRYSLKNGQLTQTETTLYGRKISLYQLRQNLLLRQEPYTRLHTEEQLLALTKPDLLNLFEKHKLRLPSNLSEETLRQNLRNPNVLVPLDYGMTILQS